MSKLFFVSDRSSIYRLSRLYKLGKLRRIHRGIYTDDLIKPISEIVRSNWLSIVPHIVPHGILSHRTAHDLRPTPFRNGDNIVFVTSTYEKTIKLPGLIIKVLSGVNIMFTEQILPDLARSNEARMLLENLTKVQGKTYKDFKIVGRAGVELYLSKCLRNRRKDNLNKILESAKYIASQLHLDDEYIILNSIISALFATRVDTNILTTDYAKAIVKKQSYDDNRVRMFKELSTYLRTCIFIERDYHYDANSFKNLSFFESYFSNYIEGTKFLINEAERIIFEGKEIKNRHADSHDVLANFRLSNDYIEMSRTPTDIKDFLGLIQERHAMLMRERPEINPGQFKDQPNMAGSNVFVYPQDVVGTLIKGFEIYSTLEDGIKKALFMHILLSEVHPFNDGNGRIARVMLNSELVKAQQYKIIMPTVYRDSYLTSLNRLSRDQVFYIYCKVIDIVQAYTANIPWSNYADSKSKIELDHAEKPADEGLETFNETIRSLNLSSLTRDG